MPSHASIEEHGERLLVLSNVEVIKTYAGPPCCAVRRNLCLNILDNILNSQFLKMEITLVNLFLKFKTYLRMGTTPLDE